MTTISRPVTLQRGAGHTLPGGLRYDDTDPLVAALAVLHPDGTDVWPFARADLADGVNPARFTVAGGGAVTFHHNAGWLHVRLSNGVDRGEVWFGVAEAVAFLRDTYRLVRPGTESAGLDAELALLLTDGAR